jgi:hypothetical protein
MHTTSVPLACADKTFTLQIFLASTFGGLFASMAAAPGLTVIDMAV